MSLNPLVEIRSWLHQTPWLWDGLIFLGDHAPELMAAAACWIIGLLVVKVRRSGEPTGAPLPEHPPEHRGEREPPDEGAPLGVNTADPAPPPPVRLT